MYPTAAAALGLGLAPHDLEEKSEATATGGASVASGGGGGGSSVASTASTNNLELSTGVTRRRSGQREGGATVRGGSSSVGGVGVDGGGFLFIPATGVIATSGPSGVVAGAASASAAGELGCGGAARATNGRQLPVSS